VLSKYIVIILRHTRALPEKNIREGKGRPKECITLEQRERSSSRGVESNARKEGRKGGSEGKEGTLLKIIQVIMKHYPFDAMWGSM
jgi:hypothetical protein